MKKLFLYAALLLGISGANAQYFQRTYSTGSNNQLLQFGVNTRNIGNGHLMSGVYRDPNFSDMIMVKTDADGLFTTPNDFSNVYRLSTGLQNLFCYKNEAIETDPALIPGVQYVVAGQGNINNSTGVQHLWYVKPFDAAGNAVAGGVLFSIDPTVTGQPPYQLNFTNARLSNNGTALYMCGSLIDFSSSMPITYALVVKVDLTTWGVLWSTPYLVPGASSPPYFNIGWDIIESPYTGELVAVGETFAGTMGFNAYIQRLDANFGTPIGQALVYANAGGTTNESFKSIEIMNNPNITAGLPGFVIGGFNDASGMMHQYLCFIDQNLNQVTSVTMDLYYIATQSHSFSQVKERQDWSGDYNYYTIGSVAGFNSDMLLMQYNSNSGAAGSYRYGVNTVANAQEEGFALDFYDLPNPAIGVASYGIATGPLAFGTGTDFYLVKSYFNGVSGCFENLSPGNTGTAPGFFTNTFPLSLLVNRSTYPLSTTIVNSLFQTQHCYSPSVTGGSNARTVKPAADPTGGNQLIQGSFSVGTVQPNPAAGGEPASVAVKSLNHQSVKISVTDLLGRTYELGNFIMPEGESTLQLDLEKYSLNKGIYLIRLETATEQRTTMLYVE